MRYALACMAIIIGATAPAAAQSPVLPVQGTLRQMAGNLVSGNRDVTFRLYNQLDGGTAFYEATKDVRFTNGQFVAYLGDESAGDPPLPLAEFDGLPEVYLGIEVSPETIEMSPRARLGTAPFALYAQTCGEAQEAAQAATATQAVTATQAQTATTANGLACSGCVSFSELDSSTQTRIDAAADDVNCSGCVDGDDIVYDLYFGPNTGSSLTREVQAGVTTCSAFVTARFCAVSFIGLSNYANVSITNQCFVRVESGNQWQVCARGNGVTEIQCAMNCLR